MTLTMNSRSSHSCEKFVTKVLQLVLPGGLALNTISFQMKIFEKCCTGQQNISLLGVNFTPCFGPHEFILLLCATLFKDFHINL